MGEAEYIHGHEAVVLDVHAQRSAGDSAGYLLPHLRSGMSVLDVGCGPGTITRDLASAVRPGRVVGIDRSPAAIERAKVEAPDVAFIVGDLLEIELPASSFDVAHAHQVLQHVTDPPAVLRRMAELVMPGGLIAAREGDYGTMVWQPVSRAIEDWLDLHHRVAAANGVDADAGRRLLEWARRAGVEEVVLSTSTLTIAGADAVAEWGQSWASRLTGSTFTRLAVDLGLASPADLTTLAEGWLTWSNAPDALFVTTQFEIIGRAPGAGGHG